ncbi:hypothetical protein OAO01_01640 [Oligoflexia bacterium]|nr:hypothetical protein [Oligoflexia bacterium]
MSWSRKAKKEVKELTSWYTGSSHATQNCDFEEVNTIADPLTSTHVESGYPEAREDRPGDLFRTAAEIYKNR